MLENYGICLFCGQFIELLSEGWISDNKCVIESGHTPTLPEDYSSHKFGDDIRTEILYNLSMEFGKTDSLGDSETFGYFEFFAEHCAILEYDSFGFVFSTIYDDAESARNAWDHLSLDYDEWLGDQEPYEDDYYGEPDFWD